MSNDISETIVIPIIDKLISNVCRDVEIKQIYSNYNNHCDKFIMKIINPYLNNLFLFHENGLDNLEKNKNQIFYNSILPKKINTWVSLCEPNSSVIDRHATNNNKVSRLHIKRNISTNMTSVLDFAVSEQKELEKNNDINKNNNKKKEKIKIKLKDLWKKPNNQKIIIKNLESNIPKKINENDSNKNNDNKKSDEKKDFILEIPGTYIPYEKNEKIHILLNNTEENDLLRKEREQIILEKEEKLKNENSKKKRDWLKERILNRQFNGDKLTFDPNGNIIKVRLPHVDSFKKEFIVSNHKIKDEIPQPNNIQSDIEQERKNLIKNNKILKTKSIVIADTNQQKNLKVKLNKKNIKELIEYNPKDKLDVYYHYNASKNEDNPEVLYSGSNFDKILPEVGVIISNSNDNDNNNNTNNEKEKNKKIGGFEYIKKYNRPSMNEISNLILSKNTSNYNEQLSSFFNYDYKNNNTNNINNTNNTINMNSKVINTNINENNKKDEKNNLLLDKLNTENNYNYIGYKEEFFDNNNPLFHGAVHIKEETQKDQQKIYNKPPLLPLKAIKDKRCFSNENILIPKKMNNNNNKPRLKKNVSYQINPLFNKKKLLISKKINFNSNNNINMQYNNTNEKYLSSMNSIVLSEKFNCPNLKSIFADEEDNNMTSKDNIIDNNKKNLINFKFNSIEFEKNKNGNINILYPLKRIKCNKYKLPTITENNNNNLNKNVIEQKYINKFNLRIMKDKNWGNGNLYNIDSNDKNGYKEQFLRQENKILKNPDFFKIVNNK